MLDRRKLEVELGAAGLVWSLVTLQPFERQIDRLVDDPIIQCVPNGFEHHQVHELLPQDDLVPTHLGAALAVPRAAVEGEEIYRRGPWKGLEDVEFATLEWVAWYKRSRLLAPLGYVPPAEFEQAYHDRRTASAGQAVLT